MPSTLEIGQKLVEHCQTQTEREALNTLYHPDAVSVEAHVPEGMDPVTTGIDGIHGKHDWWDANFEVHGGSVDGPYVNGDVFSVIFEIDATEKATGQRMPMKEVALYHVKDGKIVREEFQMKPMG
ncbi:MAG: nuclear transport factor 2 family protein [Pseudomonadota bacterium]